MEPLSFTKTIADGYQYEGHKLVPWLNWDEWNFVREPLFSSSTDSVAGALRRISAWQGRGSLPVAIEITKLFIEIQQIDFFRSSLVITDPSYSDDMLAMLYSTAIIRLVNGVIEKTRNKEEISIAEAACSIGLPRALIDIRHAASHRDPPSLQIVRIASIQALEWLKSYYWEPQKNAILFPNNEAARAKIDIECRLRELLLCLKSRKNSHTGSARIKGKGVKPGQWLCGRNKFLSFPATKLQSSKSKGLKKATAKNFERLIRLYSSFPSELVSSLFGLLKKATNSSSLIVHPQVDQNSDSLNVSIDDWKLLVENISRKEPKLLLDLISIVLENMTQTWGGDDNFAWRPQNTAEESHNEQLSCLVKWFVESLIGEDKSELEESKGALIKLLLHKCRFISDCNCARLMESAQLLAQMMGTNKSSRFVEKLNKFPLLRTPISSHLSYDDCGRFLNEQEDLILEASQNLERIILKCEEQKGKSKSDDAGVEVGRRWVVEKSWRKCPIGSSVFPSESLVDDDVKKEKLEGLDYGNGKRESDSEIGEFDGSPRKKMREISTGIGARFSVMEETQKNLEVATEGRVLIGGVWKKLGEEDVKRLKSCVRILL